MYPHKNESAQYEGDIIIIDIAGLSKLMSEKEAAKKTEEQETAKDRKMKRHCDQHEAICAKLLIIIFCFIFL